jgi:hypothetical protein
MSCLLSLGVLGVGRLDYVLRALPCLFVCRLWVTVLAGMAVIAVILMSASGPREE